MHPGVRVVVPPASSFHTNPSPVAALAVGVPLIIGAVFFMPLVINPLIVKAFKPEWSYGRRFLVGIPLGVAMGLGVAASKKLAKQR